MRLDKSKIFTREYDDWMLEHWEELFGPPSIKQLNDIEELLRIYNENKSREAVSPEL